MLLGNAGLIRNQRSRTNPEAGLRQLAYIKNVNVGHTFSPEFRHLVMVLTIAGHRNRGRCSRFRHSAFIISMRYRSNPVPDWVSLFRCRAISFGIGTSFYSVTGLTRCRTVRHSTNIYVGDSSVRVQRSSEGAVKFSRVQRRSVG